MYILNLRLNFINIKIHYYIFIFLHFYIFVTLLLYAFLNKILMYSNIMPDANDNAAIKAGKALTKQYSDKFSETFNDTTDKLNAWFDLATIVNNVVNEQVSINVADAGGTVSEEELNNQNVNIRKSFYENQAIQYLYNWNKLLYYIYYFFAMCLVISLFLSPNSFSIFAQVAVAIAVLSYPYYSIYIVKQIMKTYSNISVLFPKNVYTHYSDNNNYFSPMATSP